MKHAKLSASSSHRWMNCPGSINAERGLPNTSSPYANEGSCAHEVAEKALRNNEAPSYYIGDTFFDTTVTKEMSEYVQEYTDYVDALTTANAARFIETRVDFSTYVPEGFGTADAIVIDGGHAHVIDLKYGKGVSVYSDNNTQGMLYALGAINDLGSLYDIHTTTIHIVQPRIGNFSEWTISTTDLIHWATNTLMRAANTCLDDNAPRVASEKACQFCKAKGTCATLFDLTNEVITGEFDNITQEMTDEQVKIILDNKSLIESFLKAVAERATDTLELGGNVAGYKLVQGRTVRKWNDEAEPAIIEELGDKAYNKKLIGLTDATKLLGKDFVDAHTYKPSPKPTLAKESDARKGIDTLEFDII